MTEIFLILLVAGYLIYKVAFEVPRNIKRIEGKIDMLKLHIQGIESNLNEINKKLDNRE